MKHFAVITFALVAALCIIKSHGMSSFYGSKGPHDQLLHKAYVIWPGKWFRKTTEDVQYPLPGYASSNIITAIYVIDQTGGRNLSTGHASLSEGGFGSKHATVHIKSERSAGLNFTVEFFGHKF